MVRQKWITRVSWYYVFQPADQLGEAWSFQVLSQWPPATNRLTRVLVAQVVSFSVYHEVKNVRKHRKVKHWGDAWPLVSFKPEAAVITDKCRGGREAVLMAMKASVRITDRREFPSTAASRKLLDVLPVSSLWPYWGHDLPSPTPAIWEILGKRMQRTMSRAHALCDQSWKLNLKICLAIELQLWLFL